MIGASICADDLGIERLISNECLSPAPVRAAARFQAAWRLRESGVARGCGSSLSGRVLGTSRTYERIDVTTEKTIDERLGRLELALATLAAHATAGSPLRPRATPFPEGIGALEELYAETRALTASIKRVPEATPSQLLELMVG